MNKNNLKKNNIKMVKGDEYDKYVNKDVILTNWDGLKQFVKIIKNDKNKEHLEVIDCGKKVLTGVHYLVYKNIGEGCAVTKIEEKN